jgi:hypothetical protein
VRVKYQAFAALSPSRLPPELFGIELADIPALQACQVSRSKPAEAFLIRFADRLVPVSEPDHSGASGMKKNASRQAGLNAVYRGRATN